MTAAILLGFPNHQSIRMAALKTTIGDTENPRRFDHVVFHQHVVFLPVLKEETRRRRRLASRVT
jgi:hypothetical protein